MNQLKAQIVSKINKCNISEISELVENYLIKYPYDVDVMLIKGYLKLTENKYDEAMSILLFCNRKIPFDVDTYYLAGIGYMHMGLLIKALDYLNHALFMQMFYKTNHLFFEYETCNSLIDKLLEEVVVYAEHCQKEQLSVLQGEIDAYLYRCGKMFWMFSDIIRSGEKVIGEKIWIDKNDVRYCGHYIATDVIFERENHDVDNLIDKKGEILPIMFEGTKYSLQLKEESVIPIACDDSTLVKITMDANNPVVVNYGLKKHFEYFRVKGNVTFETNNNIYISHPIPLHHNKKRKKLVISLFVDGLSQQIIDEEGLENLMPYTYQFFEKGLRFNNAFTTSDWTYPSLASFVTGYEVPDHMAVKPDLAIGLPEDSKTIFEYMKEAGYYTTVITGDWRFPVTDGYGKSVDRFIVQHQNTGMRTETVVMDAINHIESFKETDQYLWLTTGDLHDVADGFPLPLLMQTQMKLSEREIEEIGETSVKQKYSPGKKKKYIHYAKIIDRIYKILYDYLEDNFKDDDYVITLFADHGQKFLTKPDQHHLSRSHSNVAFMVRDNNYSGISNEYISVLDYPAILCKLANVPYKSKENMGVLPNVFGGTEERDFVITETIHQGDYYMAAIRNKSYTFYFTSEHKVDEYGRLQWGNYTAQLETADGKAIVNKEKERQYVDWIKHHLRYIITY